MGGDGATVVAVVDNWPIPKRPPTMDEAQKIAAMNANGESLSSLCRIVYGFKDGATFAWIKQAVEQDNRDNSFDSLDLSTESGRIRFEQMQREGLVKLPDVSGLWTTGD